MVVGTLVGIVVDGVLVDGLTSTSIDSSAGTGFCQTDRGVGAPMLGKSVSRIAKAVPEDPANAMAAIAATTIRPVLELWGPWPDIGDVVDGREALTGASCCPSPCPTSSQLSLMAFTLTVHVRARQRTLVVVPLVG